jgi:hypothetical protein
VSSTSAESKDIGVAYFALLSPQFPCADALKIFDEGAEPALAILWGTFGTDTSCLRKWFETASEKPHTLEIHLLNGPCIRNKRCEDSEIGAGLSPKELNRLLEKEDEKLVNTIVNRIKEISTAVKRFARPGDELLLSTGLEDNYSPSAYQVILRLVKENWPYKVVRNPVGNLRDKSYAGADYLELHGANPSFAPDDRCIANLDGTDISFPHRPGIPPKPISWKETKAYVDRYSGQCRLTFLWAGAWQGLLGGSFKAPTARALQVDGRDLELIKGLLR